MIPLLRRFGTDIPLVESATLALLLTPQHLEPSAVEHPYFKQIREKLKPSVTINDEGLATVPVHGVLALRPDVWELAYGGIEDSALVKEMIDSSANNPNVRGILLSVDSPGGMVMGGVEIADAVKAASKLKPVVAHIGGMGASLGYWIASQAQEVVANRSSAVGSIGAVMSITDWTGYLEKFGVKIEVFTNKEGTLKATGTPGTKLTDEQRSYLQDRIDSAFAMFRNGVKSTRPDVQSDAMKGQVFYGADAKKLGLVDRIGDQRFAMSILRARVRANG